ncbi:hypothetical protein SAMN04487895_10360 [Paenibacillus sophorae]|uniref:Uncharacterized protein n=1 Tax=Paenibacillus sophorae TaxID=1333845 RepID=A0A1H8JKP1_9BACL|nr:hypothetical protein [Paenibacillus sophorae]QWU13394.1 hypothetical protein KP014_15445 [Paenibacillus sophorae]SEN81249.1 hypothetical protein SAMN04487895_10360 [Paenibacillus sophorae]
MSVRLDKMQAIYGGNIESVLLNVDLENGAITTIGGLVDGKREVVQGATPVNVSIEEILLIASPEIVYEAEKHNILDFVNKAGKPARAYHYTVGDTVTITDDMIDGTSVKNQYLVPENGSAKLKAVADLSGDARFAALVLEKVMLYGEPATRYKVLKH